MKTDEKNQENSKLEVMTLKDLPNLHKVEVSQKELSSEYWTPTEKGEYKVGVILSITTEPYVNAETKEEIMLPCVTMIAQNEDLTFATIRNGSVRLVATIEKAIESGDIAFGTTPVKVAYLGNEKNKTNSFKSDRWSVKPLIF